MFGLSTAPARQIRKMRRVAFLIPVVVILGIMLVFPIYYTFRVSVGGPLDLATFTPGEFAGWRAYLNVARDPGFRSSVKVTLVYLAIAMPIQIVVGFGLAFLINVQWKGRGLLRVLLLVPMMVAPVVAGGIWRILLDPQWGMINYLLSIVGIEPQVWFGNPTLALISVSLIDSWRWIPFVALIATAGIVGLPVDLFEAARVDGASPWQVFWRITMPLLTPVIMAVFVLRWLGAIKMFDIVLATTGGGPGRATEVLNLYIYERAFRSLEFESASAMAMVVLVATMIITFALVRITTVVERRW